MAPSAFFAHVRDDMVALVAGKSLEEAELRDWLKTWLAHFKLPHEIVFLDELPHLYSSNVGSRCANGSRRAYPAQACAITLESCALTFGEDDFVGRCLRLVGVFAQCGD
jgi:hypothetical protein